MKRRIYLETQPLEQARERFLGAFDWIRLAGRERIETARSRGRVTAEPVFAAFSSPGYHAAAMDGYAVRAAATFGAREEQPRCLRIGEDAHPVNTGHPLPDGCDAVIMIEMVHESGAGVVEIDAPAYPWQHVRRVGEDIVARELLLPHHHRLQAVDVASLVTAGVLDLPVLARPRVAIIPTGSELVDWRDLDGAPPAPGRIVETNSLLIAGLVEESGGIADVRDAVLDDPGAIRGAIEGALSSGAHIVVVNAGASAGSEDHTVHVFEDVGEVLVHGIAAMPGKPTILARAGDRPLVGAPGYPVSAWVCFDRFVAPALARMQAVEIRERPELDVVTARRLASKLGREEFLRVHLGRVGDRVIAMPLKRGAGAITSLTRADGVLRIPAGSDGIEEGAHVRAEMLRPVGAADRTLLITGSHDVTIDLLADHVRRYDPRILVSASNVGSLAGLIAVRDGLCHMAGTHLLDPETGGYNTTDVERHLGDVPARLVTLAHREQGLMVRPGNPDGIRGLADLARSGVTFVNRQQGSGTRVLLDYRLEQEGIDPSTIEGYDREEYTHMAVAVQVLSGGASVGLGIRAAAIALGLDFVPIVTERYDLLIPRSSIDDPRIQAVLHVLGTGEFRDTVAKLGGYDVSSMGRIAWQG